MGKIIPSWRLPLERAAGLLVMAVLALSPAQSTAALFTAFNGGFEIADIPEGTFLQGTSATTSQPGFWSFTELAGYADAPSAFSIPDPPPEGAQAGLIQSVPGFPNEGMSQTLTGFTPADTYSIFWHQAKRTGFADLNLEVLIDGNVIQQTLVQNTAWQAGPGAQFTATNASHVLEFQVPDAVSSAIFLDAISIVPEPSTALLMGLGMAGTLASGRRRRRRLQPAP